jgi:hypothetical protein
MNEKKIDVEQGFYEECAKLLDCAEHTYRVFPYRKRTRWNNRTAGNGRFPGHGLIRMFGPTSIHVALYEPKLSGQFKSMDAVYAAIKEALAR